MICLEKIDKKYLEGSFAVDDYEDLLQDGNWEQFFTVKPEAFTREEKKAYLATIKGVSLASDAFFPFGDNVFSRILSISNSPLYLLLIGGKS